MNGSCKRCPENKLITIEIWECVYIWQTFCQNNAREKNSNVLPQFINYFAMVHMARGSISQLIRNAECGYDYLVSNYEFIVIARANCTHVLSVPHKWNRKYFDLCIRFIGAKKWFRVVSLLANINDDLIFTIIAVDRDEIFQLNFRAHRFEHRAFVHTSASSSSGKFWCDLNRFCYIFVKLIAFFGSISLPAGTVFLQKKVSSCGK